MKDRIYRMVDDSAKQYGKCFQVNLTGGIDSFATASILLDMGYRVISYSTKITPYPRQNIEHAVRELHIKYLTDKYRNFEYRGVIEINIGCCPLHGNDFLFKQQLRNISIISFNSDKEVDAVCIGSTSSDSDSSILKNLLTKYNDILNLTCHSYKPFVSVIENIVKDELVQYIRSNHDRVRFWTCEYPIKSGVVYRPCKKCNNCLSYEKLNCFDLHIESLYIQETK